MKYPEGVRPKCKNCGDPVNEQNTDTYSDRKIWRDLCRKCHDVRTNPTLYSKRYKGNVLPI